jgi:energy-converting hydrogenase Eha subunit A
MLRVPCIQAIKPHRHSWQVFIYVECAMKDTNNMNKLIVGVP